MNCRRIGETGDVAEFRHQRRRGHQRRPRSACSAFTTGVSDQSGSAASMWASEMVPPSRALDGRDESSSTMLMRGVFERQSGEPAPVHQGPGRPVIMTAMAQQEAGELLARLPQHAHRRQSRAHQIADRLMGWVRNPHRRQFARSVQFWPGYRVPWSVSTRSPGLRGKRRRRLRAFVPGLLAERMNS